MKNCTSLIHQEVASKEFMEFLKEQVKVGMYVCVYVYNDRHAIYNFEELKMTERIWLC